MNVKFRGRKSNSKVRVAVLYFDIVQISSPQIEHVRYYTEATFRVTKINDKQAFLAQQKSVPRFKALL